jgi:hypothetical protein
MNEPDVLFLAASLAGAPYLQLDEEIRQIMAKVRASQHRDALEIGSLWAVRCTHSSICPAVPYVTLIPDANGLRNAMFVNS